MKHILVCGGAGFIGSHLSKALVDRGHTVICIDNISTGQEENITPLLSNPRFRFYKKDILTLTSDDEVLQGPLDQVYDLASPASVTRISDHPIEAATVNSVGVYRLLELALKKGSTFLFASSSEAYGDPHVHPQPETYWGNVNCVGVRSGYDEGKRFGEAITMAYRREKNADTRIARIFNTYGPNSHHNDSRVVPRFITSALNGQDIPVHGDGSQTRSLCYVSDLVDGLIKLMESHETMPVNLGNPVEQTIRSIAEEIIARTHSSSKIVSVPRPPDDPSRRCPDIAKADKILGWKPQITLDEGLAETIEYFRMLTSSS